MASGVQKTDKVVRADTFVAQRFELVGPNGSRLATLQVGADGKPILSFLDEKGAERLSVGIGPVGPSLSIFYKQPLPRLRLSLDETNDFPMIELTDGALIGGKRARLSLNRWRATSHVSDKREGSRRCERT